MVIKIFNTDDALRLEYTDERGGHSDYGQHWMDRHFGSEDTLYFKTLHLHKDDMEFIDEEIRSFVIGMVQDDLIFLRKEVFNLEYDFCFDIKFPFKFKYLVYTASGIGGAHINYIEKISKIIEKKIIVSDDTERTLKIFQLKNI